MISTTSPTSPTSPTTPTTGAAVVQAVAELAPRLRERAPITEEQRSVPRESMDDLIASGMVRMLVPKRYGGLELTVRDFVDATAAAAAGCPSTGWCGGQTTFAALVIAAFPAEAQEKVWASGPDVIVASTAAGLTATPVAGGYRISGKGPFASGINHADWIYPGAPVVHGDGPPEQRFFLVPRSDVTIVDTWHTAAMAGTGSNTIVLDDVFVPETFSISTADLREGTGPGTAVNPHHLYRRPWVTVVPLIYVSTMLGATQAAYEAVVTMLRGKRGPGGARSADSEELQIRVSLAGAKIDAARTVLHSMADRADSGLPYTLAERARSTRDSSYVTSVLIDAVDDVLEISGTSGFADTSFVQQAWRDVHFAATHQSLNKRLAGKRYGALELEAADGTATQIFY